MYKLYINMIPPHYNIIPSHLTVLKIGQSVLIDPLSFY